MSDLDTIKSIEDNLTAIITAQGFNFEDSSSDPKAETTPVATLLFKSEDFDYTHGQKPLYNELGYEIVANYSVSAPSTARDKAAEYGHKLRENITVNALNTGALASTKLVSRIDHQGYDVEYSKPIVRVIYKLKIRYREQ